MSLIGAMTTAISGLSAQSVAFGNISENVANSQTIGYKRVDTNFLHYLTNSSAQVNESGTVVARPDYVNSVAGPISQTDNTLGLAISGQGFFAASHPVGTDANGKQLFSAQTYYTRAGDFQLNKDGYLVNGSGEYLNGWIADPATGVLDKSNAQTIQVAQSVYKPVPTRELSMTANLPLGLVQTVQTDANGNVTKMLDSTGKEVPEVKPSVPIYDAQGNAQTVEFTWTPQPATTGAAGSFGIAEDTWVLDASIGGLNLGRVVVNFNLDGTIKGIGALDASGAVSASGTGIFTPGNTGTASTAAPTFRNDGSVAITYDTGQLLADGSHQKVTLNLGAIGKTDGVTQFAASSFTMRGLTQDGVPPGSFSGISTRASGDIYANYDNGQTRLIARVPVATFSNPDALQRQDGSSFTVTRESGDPSLQDAGSNGSGNIVVKSLEGSNVDIASEFSKLIVAQRAYSANTKMVTTADELLQQTIDMKR